ncbi:MAG: hypothetical protein ACREP6_01285 [Candidatus Binataceae bacterium]
MAAEPEQAKIDLELNEARQDLEQILDVVGRKVERVEHHFNPRRLIVRNPFGALGVTFALGFVAGVETNGSLIERVGIAALIGSLIAAASLIEAD